jgi:hypothetical protein
MFKRWAMREQAGYWHSRFSFSVRTFDTLQCDLELSA